MASVVMNGNFDHKNGWWKFVLSGEEVRFKACIREPLGSGVMIVRRAGAEFSRNSFANLLLLLETSIADCSAITLRKSQVIEADVVGDDSSIHAIAHLAKCRIELVVRTGRSSQFEFRFDLPYYGKLPDAIASALRGESQDMREMIE